MKTFNKSIKNILVTGGAGFIGSCLIRRLLNNTEFKIFNLDKIGYASDLSSINQLISSHESLQSRYRFIKADLNNYEFINNAIEISSPDIIFHLAAESHVDRSIDNPRIFLESNVNGTFNLLEATKNYWHTLSAEKREIFRFHHISTDEVFGSLDDISKFSEDTNYSPRSPYSASKASSDHFVKAWHHTYNLPIIITNCSNNYGPWQFPEKLIPLTIQKCLKKEKIPVYGNGMNIRDWLYVEDHVDALITCCNNGELGSNYCIGGHGEKKNIEVVEEICSLIDKYSENNFHHNSLIEYVKDRPGHDMRYAIDSSLITKKFNWFPKYSFEKGLEETVLWYLKNQKWCQDTLNEAK